MPKFLANIDLNNNELQNARVHNLATDPDYSSLSEAQKDALRGELIFNTSSDVFKFWNGTAWQTVGTGSGAVSSVNSQTGTVVLDADDISDATTTNKFATSTQLSKIDNLTITQAVDLDTLETNVATNNAKVSNVTTNLSTSTTQTTVTVNSSDGTDATISAASTSAAGIMTKALFDKLDGIDTSANNYSHPNHSGQVTSSGDGATTLATTAVTAQTDLGDNFASGDSFIVYDTSATGLREGTVGNLQNYMQSNLTFTTNTDEDVSNANLLTALANLESSGGATDQDIVIGTDSGDTIVITGNLQVSGTTTTIDSNTVNIGDHNIVLDSDNTTSGVVNGAGITINGNTGDDATFTYSTASGGQFEMKLGSAYENLQVDAIKAASITLNGTAILATAAEINIIDGSTSATSTTVASGDRLILNDGGVMKQINVDDLDTYFSATSKTLTNKSIAATQLTGTINNARLDQQLQDVAGLTPTNGNFIVGNDNNFVTESGSTARASLGLSYATAAQSRAGTSATTVLSPDTLAERMVVSTVDVSNATFTAQSGTYYAAVNHALGTEDVIVQLFDATTKATVYADIERKNFAGADSTNDIRIGFAAVPDNDVEVVITSVAGAQPKTASYS